MAHKKSAGKSSNGRDSESKRLGVKIFGGQHAKAGAIIIRQRGTRVHAGNKYVIVGKDYTLQAKVAGTVQFGERNKKQIVSVIPDDVEQAS